MRATKFSKIDSTAIEALSVLPPYEPKDKSVTWVRGSIRTSDFSDVIITGPRLPVLFSGRYNNVVFSIRGPGADDDSFEFETFLHKVLSRVENVVSANPDKFKPGLKNMALLQFDRDFIRPSSYGSDLPNELRVKLAVKKGEEEEDVEIETQFCDEAGEKFEYENIDNSCEMIPIIRVGYYRNNNKFGLNLTLLKGLVFPGQKRKRVEYNDLEFEL